MKESTQENLWNLAMIAAVLAVVTFLCCGCQSAPEATQAHQWERKAIVAGVGDARAVCEALLSDLVHAWDTQLDIIRRHEVEAATDGMGEIDGAAILALWQQQSAKRTELAEKADRIRGQIEAALTGNFDIALQLHDGVAGWLGRAGISEEDQQKYLDQAAALAGKIKEAQK